MIDPELIKFCAIFVVAVAIAVVVGAGLSHE